MWELLTVGVRCNMGLVVIHKEDVALHSSRGFKGLVFLIFRCAINLVSLFTFSDFQLIYFLPFFFLWVFVLVLAMEKILLRDRNGTQPSRRELEVSSRRTHLSGFVFCLQLEYLFTS